MLHAGVLCVCMHQLGQCQHGGKFEAVRHEQGIVFGTKTVMKATFFIDWRVESCGCERRFTGVEQGLLVEKTSKTCRGWSLETLYGHAQRTGTGGHSIRALAKDMAEKFRVTALVGMVGGVAPAC